MNKKEKKKIITIDICLSALVVLLGVFLSIFPTYGLMDPIMLLCTIYLVLASVYLVGYFIYRVEGVYEKLFNSLIYVFSAMFLFICQGKETSIILGTGLLISMFLIVLNKGYYVYYFSSKKDSCWGVKFIVVFLIAFLSGLVISNLYKGITEVQTLVLGYFFVTFGILNLLEPLFLLILDSKEFDKVMASIFNADKSEDKKIVRPKKVITKKPVVKKSSKKKKLTK